MRLAVSSDGINLGHPEIVPTPKDFPEAISAFKNLSETLRHGEKIIAAAGGVRALDKDKKRLIDHPHFPLWVNEPLYDRLIQTVNAPLYLENDAAMSGLGEALRGAGKGCQIVAYLTISTGVGGVRVISGKIDRSFRGFEPGNQIVTVEDNSYGYLESYISGLALKNQYDQEPENIKDPAIWQKVARYLAAGINNTIVFWSPEIVVLGGGVSENIPLDLVQTFLKDAFKIFPQPPKVTKAELGEIGGLYGALEYLKQKTSQL